MTSSLIVTPPVFLDICILCLYFECGEGPTGRWTTIDKITKILNNLRLITDKQKRKLSRDKRAQILFCMKSSFFYINSATLANCEAEVRKYFIVKVPGEDVGQKNRELMLKNYRFYLTRRGWNTGKVLEPKYLNFLTRETYSAEIARVKAVIDELKKSRPETLGAMAGRYSEEIEAVREKKKLATS